MNLKKKSNGTFDEIGFTIQRAVMSIAKCTVPVNINWIQMSAFKCLNNKPTTDKILDWILKRNCKNVNHNIAVMNP